MSRIVIMGAGGRDFHDFNTVFRDNPTVEVVAFTAAQIPDIDDRTYPRVLAGPNYPNGIPIVPETDLARIVREGDADEVILSYSDLSHVDVMHKASTAMAAGARFSLLAPAQTMLRGSKPVVAICAVRTGAGKSPTSRFVARFLTEAGLSVALVRHPMPYGDIEAMRCQRFASIADIDAANPTLEEREEYEEPVREGVVVYSGVDYGDVLSRAESEADVIVWDGGNNDLPFFAPDVHITVADALRPGHEIRYHPGELNLRLADIVIVNKVDSAGSDAVAEIRANVRRLNPAAAVIEAASPISVEPGEPLEGARVLIVEDGPTITHGEMPFGAGMAAARQAGAEPVDPRPAAVGSIRATYERYPGMGPVLPAMGYSPAQIRDLEATVRAVDCDCVLVATPVDLARVIDVGHPIRRVRYEFRQVGEPTIQDLLSPLVARLSGKRP